MKLYSQVDQKVRLIKVTNRILIIQMLTQIQ